MRSSAPALLCCLLFACPIVTPPSSDGGDDGGDDGGRHQPDAGPSGWWRDKVFYEVFVRSFADSNADGVGDFVGLTAKLDYLNDGDPNTTSDLGVDALWLMPVFPSPSYHGYDVTEYQAVNPAYGSLSEFDALLAAAHQRGIKVILDFVPNHTSSAHPWFRNARSDPNSTYRDYYVWRDTDPGWRRSTDSAPLWHAANGAFFYGYFWGEMPDLNFRNPDVQQAMLEAMQFWLQRGVDGFRIDAARYLVEALDGGARDISEQPETHAYFQRVRLELQRTWPEVLLVAEAWSEQGTVATYYGQGNEFHLAFTFDKAAALVNSVVAGNASELVNTIARGELALAGKDGFEAPFLSNHDMVRVMQELGGNVPAAKVAAATLLALPGTPFLYYGEELGMGGGSRSADEDKRTPMRWTATAPVHGFTTAPSSWYGTATEDAGVDVASQQADPSSLFHRYRKLIALRHATSALTLGEAKWLLPVGPPAVFALLRTHGASRVLYLANFSGAPVGAFTVATPGAAPSVLQQDGLVGSLSLTAGTLSVEGLAPYGFAFIGLTE